MAGTTRRMIVRNFMFDSGLVCLRTGGNVLFGGKR